MPKPISCTVLERHGDKHFRVGVAEMNGWRNSMEDAHVVHMADGEGYFGVLDGHGGGECSAWCSQRLCIRHQFQTLIHRKRITLKLQLCNKHKHTFIGIKRMMGSFWWSVWGC